MRLNKYRCWDENDEIMYYSDKEDDDCFFGFDKGVVVGWLRRTEPQTLDEPAYDYGEPCKNVMQFTGLLDKNSKESYHKDRVSALGYSNWIIEWHANGWMLHQENSGNYSPIPEDFIIIGNTYEDRQEKTSDK